MNLLFELFQTDRLQIVPGVLSEVQANLQQGRAFAVKVLDLISNSRLEVLPLKEEEQDYRRNLPDNFGTGETESVAVAHFRHGLLLTNESRVRHFCRAKEIRNVSLPSILRALWVEDILEIEEVRQIITDLKVKDQMKFKHETLEAIFSDPT